MTSRVVEVFRVSVQMSSYFKGRRTSNLKTIIQAQFFPAQIKW
jgi:hypothetical protein